MKCAKRRDLEELVNVVRLKKTWLVKMLGHV